MGIKTTELPCSEILDDDDWWRALIRFLGGIPTYVMQASNRFYYYPFSWQDFARFYPDLVSAALSYLERATTGNPLKVAEAARRCGLGTDDWLERIRFQLLGPASERMKQADPYEVAKMSPDTVRARYPEFERFPLSGFLSRRQAQSECKERALTRAVDSAQGYGPWLACRNVRRAGIIKFFYKHWERKFFQVEPIHDFPRRRMVAGNYYCERHTPNVFTEEFEIMDGYVYRWSPSRDDWIQM